MPLPVLLTTVMKQVLKKFESNVAPRLDASTIIFKIQSSLDVKVVKRVEGPHETDPKRKLVQIPRQTLFTNTRNRYGHQNGRSLRSHFHGSHRKTANFLPAHTNLFSGKDLSMAYFQCGLYLSEILTTLSISLIYSTPLSNSRMNCHQKKLFSLTLKFSTDHGSLTAINDDDLLHL